MVMVWVRAVAPGAWRALPTLGLWWMLSLLRSLRSLTAACTTTNPIGLSPSWLSPLDSPFTPYTRSLHSVTI